VRERFGSGEETEVHMRDSSTQAEKATAKNLLPSSKVTQNLKTPEGRGGGGLR